MAQPSFYQPNSSNISDIYKNLYFFPQKPITQEAQQEHQKQEEKTDQQNNFLTMLATMQLGRSLGLMDPLSALGIGVGAFLSPVGYKFGTDLLTKWGLIKPPGETEANSMNQGEIDNSINQYSTHQNPNLGNPIPDNSLRYERPENNYKNSNLLWDSVSEIPFVQSNYLNDQRQKQAMQDQKNLEFLNAIKFFQNNPFNIGR